MKGREALEKGYEPIITEQLTLYPYLSFSGNKGVPFLELYRYEEAFSFFLVKHLLHSCNATEKDYIIDPFCGSGITLFTSCIEGIPSVGFDALPFACFLSQTLPLFLSLHERGLRDTWNAVRRTVKSCDPAPVAADIPLVQAAFPQEILVTLRKMKTAFSGLPAPYSSVFFYLFFSILEECSTFSRIRRHWKHIKDKKPLNPFSAIEKKVTMVERDIAKMRKFSTRKQILPSVYQADSIHHDWSVDLPRKPTLLITSPPYVDRVDYTQTYALEMGLSFIGDFGEFKELRTRFLRSYMGSPPSGEVSLHPAVREVCEALDSGSASSRIISMLTGYFEDMNHVIETWYSRLAHEARVAMVIDNFSYQGIEIPVDLILCDMAREAGFSVDTIVVVHYKKAIQGQGDPLRESILFWKKD